MTAPGTERLTAYLGKILAPNPGPMTLDGTNTWIVGDPARGAPVVIDPGPLDVGHLAAIMDACHGQISDVVITHRHPDHSEGAARLAELASCGVRSADPAFQLGPEALADEDVLSVAGADLKAVATPGHTSDSYSFLVTGEDRITRLITGDTVLGAGTTVIAHPDGNLRSYFESLERLQRLIGSERVAEILPGHGPRVGEPQSWLAFYRSHRLERLQQVRSAWAAGHRTPREVVARVYADVDRSVWPAAEQSVAAQLEYLALEGPAGEDTT